MYDSMIGGYDPDDFFDTMEDYLTAEWKDKLKCDKKKYDLNLDDWTRDDNAGRYHQQENNSDCGVFSLKCGDYISKNVYPIFKQANM